MKPSPYLFSFIYFLIGTAFTYFAIEQNARTNSWDFFTILLIAMATFEFMVAIRYIRIARIIKKIQK